MDNLENSQKMQENAEKNSKIDAKNEKNELKNENIVAEVVSDTTERNNQKVENENFVNQENDDVENVKKQRQLTTKVDKFFKISERKSSIKQEFFAGFINFLVLSYILVVIPGLYTGVGGEQLWRAIFLATILTTIISTVCMALYANLPLVLAPGIGLASYTIQLITSGTYSFEQAMAICFLAGFTFLILTVTGLRKKIVKAIPSCIKIALPAGVGLFVLNIGLGSNNSGILDLLNGTASSFAPLVAVVSFLVMAILYARKVKGSIFIGIVSGTVLDIIIKLCSNINPFASLSSASWLPPFEELAGASLFKFDFGGLFSGNIVTSILSVLLTVFAVVLIDMFDTVGTLYATASKGGLIDKDGEVINADRAMLVDGCSAMISSCMGIPNATSYVESGVGIASGARTGLSTIFTSLFFLVAMFLSPLVQLIPIYATAPALVLVGIIMFDAVMKVDYGDLTKMIPSILTIIIMPLTNNITIGIAVGLITYTLMMLCTKRAKEVNALTYVISALFILYFVMLYV